MAATRLMPIESGTLYDMHDFKVFVIQPFLEDNPQHQEGYYVFLDSIRMVESQIVYLNIGSLVNELENYQYPPKDIPFLIDLLDAYGLYEPFYLVET